MPRAESKARGRIYKLIKSYLSHDLIKKLLKQYDNEEPRNHFLTNVSKLSRILVNEGFNLQNDEGYNENLETNFMFDVELF